MTGFIGSIAYGISQLLGDLDRFTFLLGGSDGEHASSPADTSPSATELTSELVDH